MAAAVLLASAGAAAAQPSRFEARCESGIGATAAHLSASDQGYTINNTVSYQRLTGMRPPAAGRSYVLGLTRAESRVSIQLDAKLLADPQSRRECIAPQITVALSYIPITVYVGREFPPGSCSYQEILAHEMRHLKVYLSHLSKVETVVRAALDRRFAGRPIYAPMGQAKAMLAREIDAEWMPYIKNELDRVEQLQAEIDSPQEYARLSRVCKGEVQSLIRPPHKH
ncbi:hypothetical protein Q4S45_12155 [Massilia sp. R2A-15]|uniref:hypothetical protein n=1 Tax=Massilia sp. R2A-15 TaxID=3064278 RepID=UPI002735422C|nr:hypothetical protein [Massilia sp. R2A-15]WLI87500.1 hypothetical protein Q4S45_12155 [Massilia sp. R2A-15]